MLRTMITDKGFNENQISVRGVGTSRGRVRPLPVLYVSLRRGIFHYANIVKVLKTALLKLLPDKLLVKRSSQRDIVISFQF